MASSTQVVGNSLLPLSRPFALARALPTLPFPTLPFPSIQSYYHSGECAAHIVDVTAEQTAWQGRVGVDAAERLAGRQPEHSRAAAPACCLPQRLPRSARPRSQLPAPTAGTGSLAVGGCGEDSFESTKKKQFIHTSPAYHTTSATHHCYAGCVVGRVCP